jgi:hypothetical protein
MAANSSLELTSLDFDSTKTSLKNFLKAQSAFKDYDFEGSNINILLDVLSYNTFLNSFYLNMVASESFLDSAQLRDSIVSHAKELNYLPRSKKSSRITLDPFEIYLDATVTALVMPKGTRFSGTTQGVSRTFVTDANYVNNTPIYDPLKNHNVFTVSNREYDNIGGSSIVDPFTIYQGIYQTDTYVIDYTLENQRFVMTDANIDTDSITVSVSENSGATTYDYVYTPTLLDIKSTDTKFFLQAADQGKYEVVFGDDIIGRRPRNGAVVTIEYRVSEGEMGNGVTVFNLDTDVGLTSGGVYMGASKLLAAAEYPGGSYNGADAESIEQIRFKAPRYFQTQERAITSTDYEILLRNAFPEIEAIAVFGGETLEPPLYGKVYVSVKLKDVEGLPDAKKLEYANFLAPRSPLSIDAVFIEPENLYYNITSTVNYNINITKDRPDQIRSAVYNTIVNYDLVNLRNFNVILRKSKLTSAIDAATPSIVSNETHIEIFKKIVPFLNVSQNIIIRFGVPLYARGPELGLIHPESDTHALTSSSFIVPNLGTVTLEDDGNGNVRLVRSDGRGNHIKVKDAGTIDYINGIIKLVDFYVESYSGTELRIYGVPDYDDISISGNNIMELGTDEININIKTVRE